MNRGDSISLEICCHLNLAGHLLYCSCNKFSMKNVLNPNIIHYNEIEEESTLVDVGLVYLFNDMSIPNGLFNTEMSHCIFLTALLSIIICLHTIIEFQVFLSNVNDLFQITYNNNPYLTIIVTKLIPILNTINFYTVK